MDQTNWNRYFYSHYRPIDKEWGIEDLLYYERWYKSWITYIEAKLGHPLTQGKVLELGCGIGAVSSLLKKKGCEVVGSDIAPVMVRAASKVNPDIRFHTYDVMKPYPEKKRFDYIFAFEVLEHIPKVDLALRNIHIQLMHGGWFVGSTPYPYRKNMIDPTHVNVHLPGFWREVFIKHKFSDVRLLPMSFFPFLWRVPPYINPVIERYVSLPKFVSTTLILAKKE